MTGRMTGRTEMEECESELVCVERQYLYLHVLFIMVQIIYNLVNRKTLHYNTPHLSRWGLPWRG